MAESVVVIKKLLQMQPAQHGEIIKHLAKLTDNIQVRACLRLPFHASFLRDSFLPSLNEIRFHTFRPGSERTTGRKRGDQETLTGCPSLALPAAGPLLSSTA